METSHGAAGQGGGGRRRRSRRPAAGRAGKPGAGGRRRVPLADLAARLAEAEEVDRRRLATELHDRIGQSLAVLSLTLSLVKARMTVEPERCAARLDDALALIEETGRRVRDLSAELRPPVLDDYGLGAALRWLAGRTGTRTAVRVEVTAPADGVHLPPVLESALYRAAREALSNVVRHSGAARAEVVLELPPGAVRLSISDDGRGFDAEAATGGAGLRVLRERLRAVGGEATVVSAPGRGTRVLAVAPR